MKSSPAVFAATALVALVALPARAEDARREAGASCRVSSDCANLPCVDGVCGIRQPTKTFEAPSPVARYRALTVSLVSGMDLLSVLGATTGWTGFETQFANTGVSGIVGLGASARIVAYGFVVGGEINVGFINNGVSAFGSQNAVILPGFSVGYAIPLTERLALTPAFHAEFVVSTSPEPNQSVIAELTGELALEIFLGDHGFIEPVVSMGDLQNAGAGTSGQGVFIFGVGYRLGVVF